MGKKNKKKFNFEKFSSTAVHSYKDITLLMFYTSTLLIEYN